MSPQPITEPALYRGAVANRVHAGAQLLTELDSVGLNAHAVEPQESIASDTCGTLVPIHKRVGERKANDECSRLIYQIGARIVGPHLWTRDCAHQNAAVTQDG